MFSCVDDGISVIDRGFLYLAARTGGPPISPYVVAVDLTGLACSMSEWK